MYEVFRNTNIIYTRPHLNFLFAIHQSGVCLPSLKKRLRPSLSCRFLEYAGNERNLIGLFRRLGTKEHWLFKENQRPGLVYTASSVLLLYSTRNEDTIIFIQKKNKYCTSCIKRLCFIDFRDFIIRTIAACVYILRSSSTAVWVCSTSWKIKDLRKWGSLSVKNVPSQIQGQILL